MLVKPIVSYQNEDLQPIVEAVNDAVKYVVKKIPITGFTQSRPSVAPIGNPLRAYDDNLGSYANFASASWQSLSLSFEYHWVTHIIVKSHTYEGNRLNINVGGKGASPSAANETEQFEIGAFASSLSISDSTGGRNRLYNIEVYGSKAEPPTEEVVVDPEPEPESEPTFAYPIEENIGVIPETGTFETFETTMQAAIAASRTANESEQFQEQFLDYQVIANQNPGHWAGNVEMNQRFLQTYAASGTMTTAAFESWQAYNNWVLGIQDIRSSWDLNGQTIYKVWDGNWLNYRGYNGWFIHEKSSTFNAVAYL